MTEGEFMAINKKRELDARCACLCLTSENDGKNDIRRLSSHPLAR